MSRRVFQFKCEECGTPQEEKAEEIENQRGNKQLSARTLGWDDLENKDWTYCLSCGGVSVRVWNPPTILFNGPGFTRGS